MASPAGPQFLDRHSEAAFYATQARGTQTPNQQDWPANPTWELHAGNGIASEDLTSRAENSDAYLKKIPHSLLWIPIR